MFSTWMYCSCVEFSAPRFVLNARLLHQISFSMNERLNTAGSGVLRVKLDRILNLDLAPSFARFPEWCVNFHTVSAKLGRLLNPGQNVVKR